MILSASIDGFDLHGGSNGVGLTTTDMGSPQPRVVMENRPAQHGASDATRFYGARVLPLEGIVIATTASTMWDTLDDLRGAFALGGAGLLVVDRGGASGPERCLVRVDGPLMAGVDSTMRSPAIRWSAQVLATDPRWYAQTASSASYDPTSSGSGGLLFDLDFDLEFVGDGTSTLAAVNAGTISTPPVFTITGPVTNPQIVNETTGESIYTTGLALTSGQTVVIDVAARTLSLNGTTLRPDLIDARLTTWFELAPGTNQLRLLGTGMSATQTELALSWRSARI